MVKKESSVRQYSEELGKRQEVFVQKAQTMGLKQYPHASSRVWIETDLEPGILPSHFFVGDYLPGKEEPGFREFRVHFPITNLAEFTHNLEAMEAFFGAVESVENIIHYTRSGEGFGEFIQGLVLETEKSVEQPKNNKRIE